MAAAPRLSPFECHSVSMQTTRPPVFDDRARTVTAPAVNEESSFEFLNRIAGDYWEHPRRLIELWASHLPDDAEYGSCAAEVDDGRNRGRPGTDRSLQHPDSVEHRQPDAWITGYPRSRARYAVT